MKTIFSLILIACFLNMADAQNKDAGSYNLLVGCYTKDGNTDGILVYNFNSKSGDFTKKAIITGVENPSYLAISKDGKYVYSVNENKEGSLSSFDFNAASGDLKFKNSVSSGGSGPAYILVDDRNEFVFAANYSNGSTTAVALNKDGSFSSNVQTIQDEGSSVGRRQTGPHVHCAMLSPDSKFLLSTDLGTDKINIFRFDPANKTNPISPSDPAFASINPGDGPRHIAFHPNSNFLYLVSEMGGSITAFNYKDGNLSEIQYLSMVTPGFEGRIGAADIHISDDGKFLYASNRGDANEIIIYSIAKDGKLTLAGRQSTLGIGPRNFVIDPTGKFLLVANQNSNEVIIFTRDARTGLITPTDKKIEAVTPVCLKFY